MHHCNIDVWNLIIMKVAVFMRKLFGMTSALWLPPVLVTSTDAILLLSCLQGTVITAKLPPRHNYSCWESTCQNCILMWKALARKVWYIAFIFYDDLYSCYLACTGIMISFKFIVLYQIVYLDSDFYPRQYTHVYKTEEKHARMMCYTMLGWWYMLYSIYSIPYDYTICYTTLLSSTRKCGIFEI